MVRTRMAPSPTGKLHIGTAHTTFFNFLLARKNKGVFVLRLDDTDAARNKEEFEKDIAKHLQWLGMSWDEGFDIGGPYAPYRQSARGEIYSQYVQKLIETKYAYRCFCTAEELEEEKEQSKKEKKSVYQYSGKCRNLSKGEIEKNIQEGKPFTIRVRTDWAKEPVVVDDQIRGRIEVKAEEIGDFIIVRSDGSPILLLTTTIDDVDMKITHAIRGEDMLNVSFRTWFIFKALGLEMPKYAHKPFLYAADGSKLSKRHGATSVEEFKEQGYLPEAILNYLFFVGYTPTDDEKQFYSLEEMISDFDFSHFQRSMPRFDYKKLDWYNAQYIKQLNDDELANRLLAFLPKIVSIEMTKALAPLVKERLTKLAEVRQLAGFIWEETIPSVETGWKEGAREQLVAVKDILESEKDWNADELNAKFISLINEREWKTGHFFMNLRLAMSGQNVTPPITESMMIMGKEKCLERLGTALQQVAE